MTEPQLTFAGLDLFSSGPAALAPPTTEPRLALHPVARGHGQPATPQGLEPQTLNQTGQLRADTQQELETITANIANIADGQTENLIDHRTNRTYPHTLIESFSPGPAHRLGPRWARDYRIQYRVLQP
ncbi:MAG: hypothetical protein AAF288_03180 [Planctomycetota bacterium]